MTENLDDLIAEARRAADEVLPEWDAAVMLGKTANALEAVNRERDEARAFARLWKQVAKKFMSERNEAPEDDVFDEMPGNGVYHEGWEEGYAAAKRERAADAEPVAYEVRWRESGSTFTILEPIRACREVRENFDLIPLYRAPHPAKPIEVTDVMVEAAASAVRCRWSIPDEDHPRGDLCRAEGHCLDAAWIMLSAAFAEMGKNA